MLTLQQEQQAELAIEQAFQRKDMPGARLAAVAYIRLARAAAADIVRVAAARDTAFTRALEENKALSATLALQLKEVTAQRDEARSDAVYLRGGAPIVRTVERGADQQIAKVTETRGANGSRAGFR